STLLNLMGLLDRPDSGKIFIQNVNLADLSPTEGAKIRREKMGFVFQDFNLIPVLTAYENVELTLRFSLHKGDKAQQRQWIMHLLESVGLDDHAHHRPGQLSGGQQQRVAVARALAHKPLVVFADEPTANLDSATGKSLLELMQKFHRTFGTTFVFSTHDPAVTQLATQVIHLKDGEVLRL
ncbi:MAG: ABC transporter ATP-binding protein, partial [Spirochaetales bacterium]|nr:ABC transporter ATP-binding protein [Spirochaetales bacterium]